MSHSHCDVERVTERFAFSALELYRGPLCPPLPQFHSHLSEFSNLHWGALLETGPRRETVEVLLVRIDEVLEGEVVILGNLVGSLRGGAEGRRAKRRPKELVGRRGVFVVGQRGKRGAERGFVVY